MHSHIHCKLNIKIYSRETVSVSLATTAQSVSSDKVQAGLLVDGLLVDGFGIAKWHEGIHCSRHSTHL